MKEGKRHVIVIDLAAARSSPVARRDKSDRVRFFSMYGRDTD